MKGYFIIALACCASAAQAGESLHLICAGGGSAKSLTFHNGTVWGSNGTYGTVSGTSVGHEAMSGELEFELNGDTARVRVPRVFLPPAHGGSGGWFEIKQLKVTDTLITGKIQINFVNHPALRIDRMTGTASLDGKVGSFNGPCRIYPTNAERAF